jgi:DNA-binding MarR family transcriptional regulator
VGGDAREYWGGSNRYIVAADLSRRCDRSALAPTFTSLLKCRREENDPVSGKEKSEPTLLELVLRVQGDLRRALNPIGVTPLQAGVRCYVREHPGVGLVVAAAAFRVESPTLVDVVQDLVRKGWITNRRSIEDRRVVCLRLSRRGKRLSEGSHPWFAMWRFS